VCLRWLFRNLLWFVGWCIGCNPPSVQLWHSANRATRASCRRSSATVCPFHLQDGRFTASTRHPSTPSRAHHGHLRRWTFRFCSVAKPLGFSLWGSAILLVGGVSSDPSTFAFGVRKPHANSPAHHLQRRSSQINIPTQKIFLSNQKTNLHVKRTEQAAPCKLVNLQIGKFREGS